MDFIPEGTDTCIRVRPMTAGPPHGWMVSSPASAAVVVTVLRRVDHYFASQLRHILDKI